MRDLMQQTESSSRYIYPFACHETERDLCRMELQALFGYAVDPVGPYPFVDTPILIDPNRSPYLSLRMDVLISEVSWEELLRRAAELELNNRTFKVKYIKNGDPRSYEQQRQMERQVGSIIRGKAEMRTPDLIYGLLSHNGRWTLGSCYPARSVWLEHKHKPQNYSTGLSTPVARALVNIAAPQPNGLRLIDPCCGMGNVLIEALSIGMDIVGRDINPLAIKGARVNLHHFGYDSKGLVEIGDMNEIDEHYDAAVLDMPYNLCSVLPRDERIRMLTSLKRISIQSVIVSSEPLEEEIREVGLMIMDQGKILKGSFIRNVWLCRSE
ncbi:TRM11 family SAM-dependent methyltransferase [Paenibacillus lutimineralis]|uniref:RNA methyltransferase n=1 Tax=Paenibacillus lutimineralis TaxID=2707005 RepID=A0A3S9V2P7_9BACL|nr:RNA methyltransferase [Paenibacillus lutimineralis]AZS16783.1 RNA methyltransferase [Paenibacillus lutimineralis]